MQVMRNGHESFNSRLCLYNLRNRNKDSSTLLLKHFTQLCATKVPTFLQCRILEHLENFTHTHTHTSLFCGLEHQRHDYLVYYSTLLVITMWLAAHH